jgi:hypothetical protein
MLRFHVGDDAFFTMLQTYFQQFKYGNASTWDLAGVVQDVTGENYDWFFDQWIFNGGYPEFEYFGAWETQGDSTLLWVPIAQVQDESLIDFRTNAELYIYCGDSTLIDRITIEALPTQEIQIMLANVPDSIQLDPINWILCSKQRLESVTEPILDAVDPIIVDQGGDGFIDPGESGELSFILTNAGLPTDTLSVELTSLDAGLTVLESIRTVPPLSLNDEYDLAVDPFPVENAAGSGPRWVEFHAEVSEQAGGQPLDTLIFWLPVGSPELLLVDDDAGGTAEIAHQAALDNIRRVYRMVEYVHADSLPPLADYLGVIWVCGQDTVNTLTNEDQALLQTYLVEYGGAFMLSGRGVVPNLGGTDFLQNVLHADSGGTTISPYVDGVDPLVAGLSFSIWFFGTEDVVMPDSSAGADTLLHYFNGLGAGVKYDGAYKSCLLGFGFEDIKDDAPGYSTPEELLAPLMVWFTGYTGVIEGTPTTAVLQEFEVGTAYPNPFNAQTVIPITLPERSYMTVTIYNIQGQRLAEILNGIHNAGEMRVTFEASSLTSGIYLYKVEARGLSGGSTFVDVGKMVLLK